MRTQFVIFEDTLMHSCRKNVIATNYYSTYFIMALHIELSGYDFTNIHPNNRFYKFLHNNLIHNKFRYELGVNIDFNPFNPEGECTKGGLYFCDDTKCHMYWKRFGTKLAYIEIPPDARVYIEKNKFKADKFIITNIVDFEQVPDSFWIRMLSKDGLALKYVKEQTHDICKLAIRQNHNALRYVKDQTRDLCMLTVRMNSFSIRHVRDQTEEICTIAVKQNGLALQNIRDQTENLCKLAVEENSSALQYAKIQTYDLCRLAIRRNKHAEKYIHHKHKNLYKLALFVQG